MSTATAAPSATTKLEELHVTRDRLDREAVEISDELGRLFAMGSPDMTRVRALRAERAAIQQAREDCIYTEQALHADIEHEREAARMASRRANVEGLHLLAKELEQAALMYEAALQAPKLLQSRDAFMFAGRALLRELETRRVSLPVAFYPETLAHDIHTQRTRNPADHDNADYNAPVPSFVAPVVAAVLTLQPESLQ
jgi:hypothetical protein